MNAFAISISRKFPGEKLAPADPRYAELNGSFATETHSIPTLADALRAGAAICPTLAGCDREHHGERWCCKDREGDATHCGRPHGYRTGHHFESAQHLGLDFDAGNLSRGDLLNDPFIARRAAIAYETISSTPEARRWRVLFILPERINDAETYRRAARALLHRFEASDPSVKDAVRMFYGMKPGAGELVELGNTLPMGELLRLMGEYDTAVRVRVQSMERRNLPPVDPAKVKGSTPAERYVNTAIQQELGYLAALPAVDGTRYPAIIPAALKLAGLKESPWLPPEVRGSIDVEAVVMQGCRANGIAEKHGDAVIHDAIRWGITHAQPRPEPAGWAAAPEWELGTAPASAQVGVTRKLADAITEGDHFAVDAGGVLYHFDRGVYRPTGSEVVARNVKRLLNQWGESEKWSTRRTSEAAAYIAVDVPRLWESPPPDRVNLLNGLLDLTSGTLHSHRSDFLSPVQLPIAFDPGATSPAWEKQIADTLPGDAQGIVWELMAWLLTPVMVQKAVLLLGAGGNGKSTLLRAISAFLGRENVTGVTLHRLESDRFATASLYGKLAVIAADLPSEHLAGTSAFKAVVGGDALQAERKYGHPFEFIPHCRLLFSANHPPRSRDSSPAFFRRWVVLPFDSTFTAPQDFNDLLARLTAPSELSGALNKALAALPGLRARGDFTESLSMRAAWQEFRASTDPLAVWLGRATVTAPDAYVVRDELFRAYVGECLRTGTPPPTDKSFMAAVRQLREVQDVKRTVRGERHWCFAGLGFHERTDGETVQDVHVVHVSPILTIAGKEQSIEGGGVSKDSENVDNVDNADNADNAGDLLAAAQEKGYPRVPIGPGVTVAAGPEAWAAFATNAPPDRQAAAMAALSSDWEEGL